MSAGKSSHQRGKPSGGKSGKRTGKSDDTSDGYTTICLTIFIFRGQPDVYYRRHILLYFTSPDDPGFHETVHAQRESDEDPWRVDQIHVEVNWMLTASYLNHVNAGAMLVQQGQEMAPVDIVAATPVAGREEDSGWNCQNFVLEGLQSLVNQGFQTQEWYDFVEGELVDRLVDDAVA